MDELDALLPTIPANKRDAVRAWWEANKGTYSPQELTAELRQKYPLPEPTGAPVASDATASRPALAVMTSPSSIGADVGGPRINVADLPRPGRFRTLLNTAAQSLGFNLGDEASAALTTGRVSGPEYETARRLAEYQIGRGASDYPNTALAGNVLGAVGQTMLLPTAAPERLAASGTGRVLGRGALEGLVAGGASAAGAADPGDRFRTGLFGGGAGATLGTLGTAAGTAIGSRMGTPAGRRVLGIADAGETSLPASRQLLESFDPDAPIAGADILGPMGPSRIRAAAVTPGPGQARVKEIFLGRQAQRPARITGVLEDATGTSGINPYAAAEDLQRARSQEADRLYAVAYAEPLSREGMDVAKVPQVRNLIQRLRTNRRNAGEAVPTGRVTTEELHSVRKLLDDQTSVLGNPNASSADKEAAFVLRGLRDRVDNALKANPRFAEADNAFTEASQVMSGFDLGREGLQRDPAEVEHLLEQTSPAGRLAARMGFPSSVTRAVESGTARGALSRAGLGQTPRTGRARAIDILYGDQPQMQGRLRDLVRGEEAMLDAERAAGAEVAGSSTEPNRQSLLEAVGTQGVLPTARRAVFRSFRGAPDPRELAQDVEVLGAQGGVLRQLLGEAEAAQAQRGLARLGGVRGGRGAASLTPTLFRTNQVAERSQEQDAIQRVMNTYGVSEDEARAMLAR